MPKELSDLYPKPKSYDQLKAERDEALATRRPKLVAAKIALWSTLGILTILAAYGFISSIINGSLSSAGAVIAGTSFSFLVALAGIAIFFYLFTLVRGLVARTSLPDTTLFVAVALVMVASGLLLQLLVKGGLANTFAALTALLFNFLAAYIAAKLLSKRQ